MKHLLHTLLFLTLLQTSKAQMLFYQNTYKGGASFDGVTYVDQYWQQADTIHFQNSVPAGCTLKRAFLISLKFTCESNHWATYDTPLSLNYNNQSIQFDTTNTVTPVVITGASPIIAQCWMCVKDVTSLTQNNNNVLITPLQSYFNTCDYLYYDGFYLLLLYENNTYGTVNVALYLNDNSWNSFVSYTLGNLNSVNINNDVGLSIESAGSELTPYLTYTLSSATNTVTLGTLRQNSLDGSKNYKTGLGSFYYQNGILNGLVDDSPDGFIDTTDALANINNYIPNSTITYTLSANDDKNSWTTALIMVYSTLCPAVPANADSAKVYKFCTNASMQLQATSGYASYSWFPATGLSNTNIDNPVVNTENSTNYICYVKDTAGCMHTEHAQVIVHQPPAPQSTSITTAICGGTQGTLSVTPNPHNYGYTYSVDNGMLKTATAFSNLTTGQHTLTVKDTSLGCIYTTTFTIKDTNLAQAHFYINTPNINCIPYSFSCTNNSSNSNTYVWYLNNDSLHTANLNYTFTDTGAYTITLLVYETYRQCSDTFSQSLHVDYCPPDSFSLTAPNVFTPDNDGINDMWLPIVHNYQFTVNSYQCDIYDRWGRNVFTTNSINETWSDGKENAGTYYYILHYKATGQSKGAVKEETLKGFIQLIK